MHNISILGTHSDSGKSTLTFVIAKIIQQAGYSVVPFKAQNVSNNAYVADDGSEISVAQYFQASVLKTKTSYHLNPVLLKSGKGSQASLIVEGKPCGEKDIWHYYRDIKNLQPIVKKAYNYLNERYDCVISEGAGSPVELNLMDKDLSNIFVAKTFDCKVILIADIEKGGVFASIYGVYHLLPEQIRNNVIGVIINKFRGDMSLFDKGVDIIEKEFGIPVLGVLPYTPFNFGFEDSQSLSHYQQNLTHKKLDVAVIAYPFMSNYNDFEPLISDSEINLQFVYQNISLQHFDLIILPGSKRVLSDLQWLKKQGLFDQIKSLDSHIYGLCGGYEMMFKHISDPFNVEADNESDAKTQGFGFIDDNITFAKDKVLKNQYYTIFNLKVKGFEMHYGVSAKHPLWFKKGRISGSFIHTTFDDNNFRMALFSPLNADYKGFDYELYKQSKIDDFIQEMASRIDINRLLSALL